MIYSQLVDMIGHRRKDMSFLSFFFFWKGEKRSADNVGTHVGYRGSNESCRTLIQMSDFRRCKRYMARCKGGLFDTMDPIMRRYIRRASIVNTTTLSLSLSLSLFLRHSQLSFLPLFFFFFFFFFLLLFFLYKLASTFPDVKLCQPS